MARIHLEPPFRPSVKERSSGACIWCFRFHSAWSKPAAATKHCFHTLVQSRKLPQGGKAAGSTACTKRLTYRFRLPGRAGEDGFVCALPPFRYSCQCEARRHHPVRGNVRPR
eukprot:6459894-Amphidinium_carterae.1